MSLSYLMRHAPADYVPGTSLIHALNAHYRGTASFLARSAGPTALKAFVRALGGPAEDLRQLLQEQREWRKAAQSRAAINCDWREEQNRLDAHPRVYARLREERRALEQAVSRAGRAKYTTFGVVQGRTGERIQVRVEGYSGIVTPMADGTFALNIPGVSSVTLQPVGLTTADDRRGHPRPVHQSGAAGAA